MAHADQAFPAMPAHQTHPIIRPIIPVEHVPSHLRGGASHNTRNTPRQPLLLLFVPRQVQGHARSASPPCSDLSASDLGALEIETNMADVDTCLIEIFNSSAPLLKYSMYLLH